MKPYERWHDLWQFFIVLDEDWPDEFESEDQAIAQLIDGWPGDDLSIALAQWHDAFDGATDEQVAEIVADFNPSYAPQERFGNERGWAEWVRQHLEAELARRGATSRRE